VRDDVLTSLDTLEKDPAELVAKWREILDDHEDALRDMLGITPDDAEGERVTRAPVPPEVTIDASVAEGDLNRPNVGRPVFRYPETRAVTGGFIGVLAGFGIGLG